MSSSSRAAIPVCASLISLESKTITKPVLSWTIYLITALKGLFFLLFCFIYPYSQQNRPHTKKLPPHTSPNRFPSPPKTLPKTSPSPPKIHPKFTPALPENHPKFTPAPPQKSPRRKSLIEHHTSLIKHFYEKFRHYIAIFATKNALFVPQGAS